MANFEGVARSNYFKVKDREAFEAALEETGVEIWPGVGPNEGRVALGFPDPSFIVYRSDAYDEEADVPEMVSAHLAEGEIAVFMMVGYEKMRYVVGFALAVDSTGKSVEVNIDSIYDLASRELSGTATSAEY